MMSIEGKLITYSTTQNIDGQFIIECIDEVAQSIEKPTVLVLDQAPWHTAQKVLDKLEEWEEKDLYIFYLPTYSPHLNLIENLWRKMKYEWLEPEDYLSKQALKEAIFNIIKNYDHEFAIEFSNNLLE